MAFTDMEEIGAVGGEEPAGEDEPNPFEDEIGAVGGEEPAGEEEPNLVEDALLPAPFVQDDEDDLEPPTAPPESEEPGQEINFEEVPFAGAFRSGFGGSHTSSRASSKESSNKDVATSPFGVVKPAGGHKEAATSPFGVVKTLGGHKEVLTSPFGAVNPFGDEEPEPVEQPEAVEEEQPATVVGKATPVPTSGVVEEEQPATVVGKATPVPTSGVVEEASRAPTAEDIFLLARQQNFEVAGKLLEAYPQFWTCKDEDGHSLLHWAALVGNKEFVHAGLCHGVFVDCVANNQQTPLMWAVLRGHVPVARQLLQAKANMTLKDSLGATALMIAVQHKSYAALLLLMHRGEHLQRQHQLLAEGDKNGCTAAHWGAYKGDLTALKLLHYFKADLQTLDSARMQPLHRAVCASQGSVVEFLVQQRADIQARNHEGKSCMDIAAEKYDVQMQALLKRLVQKSPDTFSGGKVDPEDVEAGPKDKADENGAGKKSGFFKGLMQDKAAHKIFPVFWLVCVSLAVFQYIMDLRVAGYEVAPSTAFTFEILVPLSLAIFSFVALGDPGKVPSRPQGHSGVEELMMALDTDAADKDPPDVNRLCTTTWVLKGLRTKYCVQTGACVEEFDHYCVWLNNTIGKANHRQFVGLAIVEFLTQVTHVRLCLMMATTLVPYTSFGQFLWGVITGYPLLTLIVLVHCITAPWVFMLTLHQARLVLMNLTTNEMMNMHRYEHFWVARQMGTGHVHKSFRNPFNKGSPWKNCLDFWWYRRRGEVVEQKESCCSHGGCSRH